MKDKYVYYLFRLRSSRGTDICHCLKLQAGKTPKQVREIMEEHSDNLTYRTAIEHYTVTYKRVKLPKADVLQKKIKLFVKRRQRNTELLNVTLAMRSPGDRYAKY